VRHVYLPHLQLPGHHLVPGVWRPAAGKDRLSRPIMPSVVARAAIAPVLAQAGVRSEQVTQLILGETAALIERRGEWIHVCTHADDYDGWIHAGYLTQLDDSAAADWRSRANGWSEGAVVQVADAQVQLPLRARVVLDGGAVLFPDGRRGRVTTGRIRAISDVLASSRAKSPERWAFEYFPGTPYQWGGVTPWGVDCSGLVQTTFAARGVALPRDSAQQINHGAVISFDDIRPGDLLFFRSETGQAITHVAFASESDTLVHSAIACGGTVVESWLPGTRAASLRERLVAARRLDER
jgi:gamma-D-glutamyl-L-lysine dipeptidyl-peptidase